MARKGIIDWIYGRFLLFRLFVDVTILLIVLITMNFMLNKLFPSQQTTIIIWGAVFIASLFSLTYIIRKWRKLEPWNTQPITTAFDFFNRLSPYDAELKFCDILTRMGYSAHVTKKSEYGSDHGVDIIAKKNGNTIAVQVKKWAPHNLVGAKEVQMLLGSMFRHKADKCILMTTSDFTEQAYEQAKDSPIELWNGKYLESLLKKYGN